MTVKVNPAPAYSLALEHQYREKKTTALPLLHLRFTSGLDVYTAGKEPHTPKIVPLEMNELLHLVQARYYHRSV